MSKSNLGIILAAIIGFIGLGAVGSVLTKGAKAAKAIRVTNTANKTVKSVRAGMKPEEGPSFSEDIKFLEESYSVMDTAKAVSDFNEPTSKPVE